MTKAYTASDFSSQIVEDRTWRIREITDLRSLAGKADKQMQRVLLRATVTISYAHWEGYVRFCARKYMEHISLRKFKFSDLERQFWRNRFLPRLALLSRTNTSLQERCDLVESILTVGDERFSGASEELINTRSNLNFQVFSDICLVCAVDTDRFLDNETFIDKILLRRRNAIAHGEDTFIEVEDLPDMSDKTIAMMRMFGDELDNKVQLQLFKQVRAGT